MKYCCIKRLPNEISIDFEERSKTFNAIGNENFYNDVTLSFLDDEEGTSVYLVAQTTAVKSITLKWTGEFSENGQVLGDAIERAYGNLEWKGFDGNRVLPWYALVNKGKQTACYGVKVRPNAFCSWKIDGTSVTLILDVTSGSHGVNLKGRKVELCKIISAYYDGITPFEAGVECCKLMCTDGVFPKEKVYGSNNWYYAYGKSSEKEIERDADYLMELTEGLSPRPYMVIDDCWQKNVCAGPWDELNKKFSDMQKLAKSIKDRGLKAGIWLRPLCYRGVDFKKEWILRTFDDGNCVLDITVPEAKAYVLESFARCRDWGYQLIKFDFTTHDIFHKYFFEATDRPSSGEWRFKDDGKTNAEIIVEFYRDIKKTVGDVIIIGCNTVSHLSAGIFELNRTGDDTSGKQWKRTKKMGFNTLAFRMMQHNIFYTVDADCVGITRRIPWRLNREWLNILAVSGTPLFISSKKGVANKKQIEEIKNAFAINSRQNDILFPVNWQSTKTPDIWNLNGEVIKIKI